MTHDRIRATDDEPAGCRTDRTTDRPDNEPTG